MAQNKSTNEHLGKVLSRLADTQSKWSQETFGSDETRGPIGALKHLILEAKECIEHPECIEEYADCLLLIMDAARRSGYTISQVIHAAERKMVVNKSRKWSPIIADEPIEHTKSQLTFGDYSDEVLDSKLDFEAYGEEDSTPMTFREHKLDEPIENHRPPTDY